MGTMPNNVKELDKYRFANSKKGVVNSRYGTLKELYGRKLADIIMRKLEISSWDMTLNK